MKILVIEDNHAEADLVKRGLTEEGHNIDIAHDAAEGEYLACSNLYDLIVLDLNLPDKDGVELCKSLRRQNNHSRILMLTGRDTMQDKVRGLDSGADDYLTKPFDFPELAARVRALMRRDVLQVSPILEYSDIFLNTATREVKRNGKIVELTKTEYLLLEYFLQNQDIVLTRQMIENHVWNYTLDSESNLIDTHISRLRRKLGNMDGEKLFKPVYGIGYKLGPT